MQRVLPKCDPVNKVTIISRGMALGYTMALPTEDRYLQSKTEFEDKIAGLLGGNAAERLIFGDTTTGASNDIEKATDLARRMVTEWGMSDKMGPLSFGKRDEMIFLGREIGEPRNYSDAAAQPEPLLRGGPKRDREPGGLQAARFYYPIGIVLDVQESGRSIQSIAGSHTGRA